MGSQPVEGPSLLALFFYGTLKRGQINHERFCRGYARAAQATVRGRLYDLPFGFPAIVVPREDVRATGTTNPLADAATQRRQADGVAHPKAAPRVSGELLVFDDFEERLPALDRFEGFDPESGNGLYRRVLVPVVTRETSVLAWIYAIERPSGVHLPDGRWPREGYISGRADNRRAPR